jgi:hypothetical protein
MVEITPHSPEWYAAKSGMNHDSTRTGNSAGFFIPRKVILDKNRFPNSIAKDFPKDMGKPLSLGKRIRRKSRM